MSGFKTYFFLDCLY